MAFVTVRIKGVEGFSQVPLDQDRNVVGRASVNQVSVAHTSISREHCALVRSGDGWNVEDLGSANGTWVGTERVNGSAELTEGSVIKCGQARLTFHRGSMPSAEETAKKPVADEDAGDTRLPGDPHSATVCSGCGMWLSIAHRPPGSSWSCPRCGKRRDR